MTFDESEQIEELLSGWYQWQIRESNKDVFMHWYRPSDNTCRGYIAPSSDEDGEEAAHQDAGNMRAEQVQLCIDALPVDQRAAISVSMRNKDAGQTVWSSARAGDQHATYQAAKTRLLPMFVSRGLLKRSDTDVSPSSQMSDAEISEIRRLIASRI